MFGFGVEHFMTNNVSLRAEYLRSNYKKGSAALTALGWGVTVESEFKNEDLFRFGVSYHF
jgi:opacity protein-like surface antigen